MNQSGQFVKYRKLEPIEKKSSFYLMMENVTELESKDEFVSKKIQFVDTDGVWWISVTKKPRDYYTHTEILQLKIYLQTTERIWKSESWTYSISGTVNGTQIDCAKQRIYKEEVVRMEDLALKNILKEKEFVEIKLTMTMSQSASKGTQSQPDELSLQKFRDTTVQHKKIIANNKRILKDPKYSDFTFIVQKKEFKVHKNILAAASPVFDRLFSVKLKENRTNKCCVNDVEPVIFQYLLNFIYFGEMPENLLKDFIPRKLFEAAHYYQIDELVDICRQEIHYRLSVDNAEETYKWACTYELKDIKMDAWNIIKCDILDGYGMTKPPPPVLMASLIAKKKENDMLLEKYRLGQIELQASAEKLYDKKENA